MPIELQGMDDLLKSVRQMGKKASRSVEEKALKAGGDILLEAAKEEANRVRDDGTLYENIEKTTVNNGKITIHTGKAYHAHLIEFGRSSGQGTYKDKNGVIRPVKWGDTAPNPVMARAFENSRNEIITVMRNVIKKELDL